MKSGRARERPTNERVQAGAEKHFGDYQIGNDKEQSRCGIIWDTKTDFVTLQLPQCRRRLRNDMFVCDSDRVRDNGEMAERSAPCR